MLSTERQKIHPVEVPQVALDLQGLAVHPPQVGLRAEVVFLVAVEALAVAGAVGGGRSSIHCYNIERCMTYMQVANWMHRDFHVIIYQVRTLRDNLYNSAIKTAETTTTTIATKNNRINHSCDIVAMELPMDDLMLKWQYERTFQVSH